MSREILEEIRDLSRTAAIDACWRQWRALGALVSAGPGGRASAIIDPEALLLLSAAFQEQERRLQDILYWWAAVGSTLVSTQRLKALLALYPQEPRSRISKFAQAAQQHGDRRWRRLALQGEPKRTPRLKGPESPVLEEPAAVLLRLRAGFGVGLKPDLLALLLGMRGSALTVRQIVQALGYSRMPVSVAVREMARAKLLEETGGRPAGYFINPDPWTKLLKFDSFSKRSSQRKHRTVPAWRSWHPLFAFLTDVFQWGSSSILDQPSPYVLSSQARDLCYAHQPAFTWNRIVVPAPQQYKGETYLDAFRLTVDQVSKWLEENL